MKITASKEDRAIILKIAKKAKNNNKELSVLDVMMDLSACHLNGCKLDLERLHNADSLNLMHDVYGINQNIDRNTGRLQNCFVPRHNYKS